MNNRILAMLLAIIMIVSIVPVNAFADEGFVHEEGCPVGNNSGTNCTCEDKPNSTPNPGHTCTDTNRDGTCETCKKHIHALEKVAAVEATCQQAGNVEYYKCSYTSCGMCYQNSDGTVYADEGYFQRDKLSHVYGSYVTTDPEGHYRLCTKCNTAKSTLYPHTLECKTVDGVIKNVCKICGYTEAHTHADADSNSVCDACQTVLDHVHVDTKDNNCKCDIVGCDEPVHINLENHEAEAATCTEQGRTAFTFCKNCQKYFSDAEAKTEITQASTYTEAAGHKLTKVDAVANTCKEIGNIAYYACDTCGEYFEDEKAEKAITNKDEVKYPSLAGHTWSTWAGEDETGHVKTCTVCGTNNTKRAHGDFSYEDGKQICGDCGYEFDHICVDTYAGGNHKCDACGAELEHNVVWHSNDAGKHYSTCEKTNCFKAGTSLNGWEDCVDEDKDCVCDDCEYAFPHAWSTEISYDETHHFQLCTNCGTNSPKVAHDLSYGSAVADDELTHTRTCKQAGCEYQVVEDHNDGSRIDHVCGSCNAEMVHDWEWDYGPTSHHLVCEICDKETAYVAHAIEEGDCQCECGYGMPHTWSTEIHYTEEGHFNVCTNCGAESEKMAHDLSFGSAKANNNLTHTKTCKLKGCNYQVTENHNDGTNSDHKCGACRAEMVHDWEWDYGPTSHRQKCKVCGTETAYAPHVDAEAPFCECDVCGAELTHGRTYVEWVEPTCTTDGHTDYYECEKCGLKYLSNGKETDPTIPALGHEWGPVKSMSNSTYCGDLNHFKSCLRDNCDEVEIIDCVDADDDCDCDLTGKLMHSHQLIENPGVEATCTEDGYEAYFTYFGCDKVYGEIVEIPATGHDEDGEWEACEDGENHAKYCLTCEELLETEEHDFTGEAPYCVDCGAAEGLEFVAEVPATCTATGMKAYWISGITNRRYSDAAGTQYISNVNSLVIPKLAHAWAPVSSNGKTHVIGCENCVAEYEEACSSKDGNCICDVCATVFDGHKLTAVEAKAPTCTKTGVAASMYCAKCDKYYAAETGAVLDTAVIKALGHQWQLKWYNDTREGTHSKDCLRTGCDEKISEAHELTAYDVYSGNLHEWRCSVCNHSESDIHTYNGDTICDECGHDTGKTVDVGSLDNHRETIVIKGDEDDTVEEKKSSWWSGFVGNLNPSYVGEGQSSSAPSASVDSSLPNGSGISSGSTGASQSSANASTTSSSTVGAVIDFLWNLLSNLFGL